jgi:predicted secreted hydrolase
MKKTAVLFICLLCTVSCATNPFLLRPFHAEVHGSAAEEWAPHRGVNEWWYATGVMQDADGNPYLCQFTIFHGFMHGVIEGYILHLAVTDVKGEKRYFFEASSQPNAGIYGGVREIAFKDNRIILETEGGAAAAVKMDGQAPGFSFSLSARLAKPPAWHGENGIIVMGHPEKSSERSFYYSFTAMNAEGVLMLAGKSLQIRGSVWLDRQWGAFTENAWDWFSLRLFDGSEFMLFSFPGTGYACGTRIGPDGSTAFIPEFTCEKLDLMRHTQNGLVYLLGWRVRLPNGDELKIVPLLADQGNPARSTPQYWEGICDAISPAGERLGYCVVETTAGAQ